MHQILKKLLVYLRKARPYLQSISALFVIARVIFEIVRHLLGS